ncbi:MAG: chromosome segregation protein SMC [Candidatus Omnitrophica bacterium]|nr:chromosome segregation protein SMC [Candidatus Omnitrophota bacterium]MDD5487481.1 chromosome segregation protein SMC [Candidatus Omnitrophota bacterium]
MYFKSLEILGFKSFLNKTKLKFEPGVTAIVGPNGCGKSNIVDSIKWVLGEQSAKSMRSSAMQDVIFNGTEKHDPLGFAEVSLTLSNEDRILPVDYDEVTVTRRLYRSGESEYLLNKMPVRLADIRGLLMGTGIGTSSYSVVEQGRMDMVLSSKPEERRYLFEEASGITRYKSQKREAMLKLERTQENLVRINDIVREVERQIRSIERQARKAERYKTRYEELKGLEVKQALKKYHDLGSNDSSIADMNGDIKRLAEEKSSALEGAASALAGFREDFKMVMEKLQEIQNQVTIMASELDKNRHVITVNRERVEELQKYVERLDWEIEDITERREGLKTRLEELDRRFGEVNRRRTEKDAELAQAEENVRGMSESIELCRHELKFSRERTVDIVSEATKARNLAIKLQADISNAVAREKRLKAEKVNVEAEKTRVVEEVGALDAKAEGVKGKLEGKKKEFYAFNEEYQAKHNRNILLGGEKSDREKQLNAIRPRRQFLEKLISEREGINDGAKVIMERVEAQDQDFKGVCGILSEIVNVKDGYGEAMESVMGYLSQAVVVETRSDAQKVMSFLREGSMENVSLIILEELSARATGEDIPGDVPGFGPAMSVIRTDERYIPALRELLSRTLVAGPSSRVEEAVSGTEPFPYAVLGEKGEISRRGVRRSRNYSGKEVLPLFGRQEKVREMLADEERIEKEIEGLNAEISVLENWIRDSQARKEHLESDLRECQMEFADISSRRGAVRDKLDSIDKELNVVAAEIAEESGIIISLREELSRAEEKSRELEEENIRLNAVMEESQLVIQDKSRLREEALFAISDIKAELSGLRKEEENISENLTRERTSFERMEHEVGDKRGRIAESGQRIKELNEQTKELETRIGECEKAIGEKNDEITLVRESKEELSVRVREEEEKVKRFEKELEEARDRIRDLDIQKKELEYKRQALVDRMLETYKVDIEKSLSCEGDAQEENWQEVEARINDLKDQIDKMGEVSLGAVEEHKQLEERFQFLTKQRDDLVESRESLLKAIRQINQTTRKLFIETFDKIKVEFNSYFRMLFNGGKAELVLQDESNVLECGIDIVVRPPGKKLHNIMQLSGGEKAMTAIALIFAIFKVNPSPFCILDEIDAPLDESNIVRFCRVLQEFLKLSQFIIVTHNRMTIQLADVLYGITMQEKGVSKIVSVKFTEDERSEAEEPAAVVSA